MRHMGGVGGGLKPDGFTSEWTRLLTCALEPLFTFSFYEVK